MTKEELLETIRDTIRLLQEQETQIDTRTINQLGWNLGWHQGIYYTDILEDHIYDHQAISFGIKLLEDILETQQEEE